MANEVLIKVSGQDDTKATFDGVRKNVEGAGRAARESGDGFDKFGEAADVADTRAMGFRDTMTGVQDTMKGTSMIAKGDLFNGFLTLGMGVGDLGSGIYNFLVPAFKAAVQGGLASAVSTAKDTAAKVANRAVTIASAVATRTYAAAQWVLNAALRANPIGIIITLIAALVAGIIIAYKRSETFRTIVQAAFKGTLAAGQALWRGLVAAFHGIVAGATALWDGLKRVFRAGADAIGAYARFITAPYRAAFAGIKAAWNATVGGRGFTLPGWIPGVGGKSFRFPYLASGGVSGGGLAMVGERGPELAMLAGGSRVRNAGETRRLLGATAAAGGTIVVQLVLDGTVIAQKLVPQLALAESQGQLSRRIPGTGLA